MFRVILCPVGLPARVTTRDNPWEAIKDRLGRDVTLQAVRLDDGVILLSDEDGERTQPPNREIPGRMPEIPEGWTVINPTDDCPAPGEMGVHRIYGDFLLTRYAVAGDEDSEDEWADLSDADVTTYLALLNGP